MVSYSALLLSKRNYFQHNTVYNTVAFRITCAFISTAVFSIEMSESAKSIFTYAY